MEKELKQINLSELTAGYNFSGVVFLASSQKKVARNGNTYFDLYIKDNSITNLINIKQWDLPADATPPTAGGLCMVRFLTESYNDTLQGRVNYIKEIKLEETPTYYNDIISRIVPTADINVEEEWAFINKTIESFGDAGLKAITHKVIEFIGEDKFKYAACGKSVHGAARSGFLEHISRMLHAAVGMAATYKNIDRDLLFAAVICHDAMKIAPGGEFDLTELMLVSDYTEAQMFSHLYLGGQLIRDLAKEVDIDERKAKHLEYCITVHHGRPEFKSACGFPGTIESQLLFLLDEWDSEYAQMDGVLSTMESGTVSEPVKNMDGRRLWKAS